MFSFGVRNLKVFFKDKASVFFSLFAVFIVIGLYALFLGDMLIASFNGAIGARYLMDTWIMAGLLSITSVTTTMGAFGIMVDDKARKINKDFIASPVSSSKIVGGYVFSSIVIGILMSLITLILAQIYVVANGGELLSIEATIKTVGLIILATISNSSIIFFMVTFFKSNNAFATASTVIGTLIGFLTGMYVPMGQLPQVAQTVIKCFPPSHASALFRQVMMEAPMKVTFAGGPAETLAQTNKLLGVTFSAGDTIISPFTSVMILIGTAIVFYTLSIWNVSRKRK